MDKAFKIGGAIIGAAAAGVGAYFGKKAYDKRKKSSKKREEACDTCEAATNVAEEATDDEQTAE